MIDQNKKDLIYNALAVGMALDDAYVYAGLTPAELLDVENDVSYQLELHRICKGVEFGLLNQLNEIANRQARTGNERATTWMLEHFYPRYSGKPQEATGEVHLHFSSTTPIQKMDTVEVHE